MKFKGEEIKEVTVDIANESANKMIGIRCTVAEAHTILDFIDKNENFQVLFRHSYKTEYQYYVYFLTRF